MLKYRVSDYFLLFFIAHAERDGFLRLHFPTGVLQACAKEAAARADERNHEGCGGGSLCGVDD